MPYTITKPKPDRRQFLATMGLGGLYFTMRGAFAQALVQTPAQTLGPYYPDKLPLDQDNDLLIINDAITPAVGAITWIYGNVLDSRGQPVRAALVEIWQADNNGAYIHSASPIANRDSNFQGYGRFLTASSGEYLFRSVKPGLYPGRRGVSGQHHCSRSPRRGPCRCCRNCRRAYPEDCEAPNPEAERIRVTRRTGYTDRR